MCNLQGCHPSDKCRELIFSQGNVMKIDPLMDTNFQRFYFKNK